MAGWKLTHSFSFARYYGPKHMNFRHLRVANEDRVYAGTGFDMHFHSDMEIITYMLDGSLKHQDNMENKSILHTGEAQRISAGTGIMHSGFNPSESDPVYFPRSGLRLIVWELSRVMHRINCRMTPRTTNCA